MRPILSPPAAPCDPCARGGLASLEGLPIGRAGKVVDVGGEDLVTTRLLEMGLTPGVTVRVLGRAPFGDPMEVELRGYRLSLRRAEATRVTIEFT